MRTARGLPFAVTEYMSLIIRGIIGRVQRDHKVDLIHDVFMANHAHLLIRALDRDACKRFYGEVQKQLTDAIKRLTGKKHLNLWRRNSTSVVRYGDIAAVQRRIAYIFANPARANLVDSIGDYPGISSYRAFLIAPHSIDAEVTESCPWIQAPTIRHLPALSVTSRQDRFITERMRQEASLSHDLIRKPNVWMEYFGITDPGEIAWINQEIKRIHLEFEAEARELRRLKGWKVMGRSKLLRESINLTYAPPKSLRIFVYAVDRLTRMRMIWEYRDFCERCRRCYERWVQGDFTVAWPAGAYPPAPPVNRNYLATALN